MRPVLERQRNARDEVIDANGSNKLKMVASTGQAPACLTGLRVGAKGIAEKSTIAMREAETPSPAINRLTAACHIHWNLTTPPITPTNSATADMVTRFNPDLTLKQFTCRNDGRLIVIEGLTRARRGHERARQGGKCRGQCRRAHSAEFPLELDPPLVGGHPQVHDSFRTPAPPKRVGNRVQALVVVRRRPTIITND